MINFIKNTNKIVEEYTNSHQNIYIQYICAYPDSKLFDISIAPDSDFNKNRVAIFSDINDSSFTSCNHYTLNLKDLELHFEEHAKRPYVIAPKELNNKLVLLDSYEKSHIDPRVNYIRIKYYAESGLEVIFGIDSELSKEEIKNIVNNTVLDLLVYEKE